MLIAPSTIPTPGSLAVRSVLGPTGFSKVIGALEEKNDDPGARSQSMFRSCWRVTILRYHLPQTQNRITIATTTTAADRAPKWLSRMHCPW